MGSSIEAGWVFRRRHLIVLVGVVAPQIAQPMLAHDSVVHRILYDVAFGAITLLVSFAIFLRAWGALAGADLSGAIAPLCERGVLLCQDPPFVKGRFRRAKISPLQKGRSVRAKTSPFDKGGSRGILGPRHKPASTAGRGRSVRNQKAQMRERISLSPVKVVQLFADASGDKLVRK